MPFDKKAPYELITARAGPIRAMDQNKIVVKGQPTADFKRLFGYNPQRVQVWIQWVSPALAAEWLLLAADGNRRRRVAQVEKIARDMAEKQFVFTGVPIIFAADGTIIDGQHRLDAAVQAGEGFWTLCVRGIDRRQAMAAIDATSVRTHSDRLKLDLKVQEATLCASISLLLWQFGRPSKGNAIGGGAIGGAASYPEIKRVFKKYRTDIEWAIATIGSKIDSDPRPVSSGGAPVLAAFAYLRQAAPSKVDAAARAFKTGDYGRGLAQQPMKRLREVMGELGAQHRAGWGNKSSSSQYSRRDLSLITLAYLRQMVEGNSLREKPKADLAHLAWATDRREKAV